MQNQRISVPIMFLAVLKMNVLNLLTEKITERLYMIFVTSII